MFVNKITYDLDFFSLRLNDFYFALRGCTDFYSIFSQKKRISWSNTKQPLSWELNPMLHPRTSDVLPLSFAAYVKTTHRIVLSTVCSYIPFLRDTAPRKDIFSLLFDSYTSLLVHTVR